MGIHLHAAEYRVEILNASVVKPGDEVKAKITRVDGDIREEFFNGQIIDNVLYVLEDNNEVTKLLVKPAPKKEKMLLSDKFEVTGAQFKDMKVNVNYTVFENDFKLTGQKKTRKYFWITLLALLLIMFTYFLIKKQRAKNQKKKIRKEFVEKILSLNSRKEFEWLYENKEQLLEYFTSLNLEVTKLLVLINEKQYQKQWSQHDLDVIEREYQVLKKSIRRNDGV